MGNHHTPPQLSQHNSNITYTRQFGYHVRESNTIIKQYQLTSSQQQKSFQNLIKMYSSFNVPTILPILSSQPINMQHDIRYGWRLRFKYLGKTLENQICQKIQRNQRYNQDEILKAVDCMLSALMGFKLKKLFHENVNTQNVFIDYYPQFYQAQTIKGNNADLENQQNKVYVVGLPLLLNIYDMQHILREKQYEKLYLSPNSLRQLQQEKLKPIAGEKNDVFSLGLVILRMASLSNIAEIYDYENFKIKMMVLEKKIFECREYYSSRFCNMIKRMTQQSQRLRPDFTEVFDCFSSLSSYRYETQQKQLLNSKMKSNNFSKQSTPKQSSIKRIALAKSFQKQYQNKQLISQVKTPQFILNQKNQPIIVETTQKKRQYLKNTYQVQSEELLRNFFVSRESEKAWDKFKSRIANKTSKNSTRKLFKTQQQIIY